MVKASLASGVPKPRSSSRSRMLQKSPAQIVEDNLRRSWSEDEKRGTDSRESDTDASSCASSASSARRRRMSRREKNLHMHKSNKYQPPDEEGGEGGENHCQQQEEPSPITSSPLSTPKDQATLAPKFSPTTTATNLHADAAPAPPPVSPSDSANTEVGVVVTPTSSTNTDDTSSPPINGPSFLPAPLSQPSSSLAAPSSLPPRPSSPYVNPHVTNQKTNRSRRKGHNNKSRAQPHQQPQQGSKFFPFRRRRKESSSQILRITPSHSESEAETESSTVAPTMMKNPLGAGNGSRSLAAESSPKGTSSINSSKKDSEEESYRCGSDEDPVVKLFEQRTTQRVRFTLEGVGNDDMPPSKPSEQQQEEQQHQQHQKQQKQHFQGRLKSSSHPSAHNGNSPPTSPNRKTISRFMKGALFGGNNKAERAAVDAEVARELESVKRELVWENTATATGGEMVRTQPGELTTTFLEDPQTRAKVIKLLNKARRAQYVHFRYEYAVKCYVKALDLLQQASYPNDHPVTVKTMEALNHAHHVLSSYNNSSNIVKMGIKYEDQGELVRALKMYTIAYRIRVELLGRQHPSLVVLLNMLGNIQIRRGELQEAMQIYELALKDETGGISGTVKNSPKRGEPPLALSQSGTDGGEENSQEPLATPDPPRNLLARSVTYRDMGTVYEKWGEHDSALAMYHRSLDCLAKYKKITGSSFGGTGGGRSSSPSQPPLSSVDVAHDDSISASSTIGMETVGSHEFDSNKLRPTSTHTTTATANATGGDDGMEVLVGRESKEDSKRRIIFQATSDYDFFFPPELDDFMREQHQQKKDNKKDNTTTRSGGSKQHQQQQRGDFADMDAAMTLHQIGQLHRSVGEYNLALSAFSVSLRGMKYCVGRNHPNVAAILGNIGNLQKEMGDMDSSFATYQQVLGIESYRLGLSHPDVAVTLHNIATIDAARGNHEHALALYRQVIALQRKLFGPNHLAVAVTSACMGDVYERVGEISESIACFEEAVRIKTVTMGRHSLEVARLIHKLGKLAISQGEFHLADSYVSRAILIYRLNRLSEQDEWMVEAARDGADIDAAIALGFVEGTPSFYSNSRGGHDSSGASCDHDY
ncbi:hypothetical protein ACA910_016455 [Epithemia clementina (nom. ined.)]